jgi:hypothetical protein
VKPFTLALVLALAAGLSLGCGPRHNKEKKRGVYAGPKNAQEAAWQWPGEKIEARDADGVVAMRLRVRGTRIRVFGHKMVSVGDVRRDGDGYMLSDTGGVPTHRIAPPATEAADRAWTVCAMAAPTPAGDPEPACTATPFRLLGGATVQILDGDRVVSLARPDGNGAIVEAKGTSYQLQKTGRERYSVTASTGSPGTITGAQSAFVAGPLVAEEIPPLLRAGFTVLVEDHHGKWSLKP